MDFDTLDAELDKALGIPIHSESERPYATPAQAPYVPPAKKKLPIDKIALIIGTVAVGVSATAVCFDPTVFAMPY